MTTKNTILFPYWCEIRNGLDSSRRTPKRVVREVLNHQRTRRANYNAEHQPGTRTLSPLLPLYKTLIYGSDSDDIIFAQSRIHFKEIVEENGNKKHFGSVLPHLSKYLDRKDILKCRQVCKQWDVDVCSLVNSDSSYNEPPRNECRDLEVANYLYKVRKGTDQKLAAIYDDITNDNNDNISQTHYLRHNSRFFLKLTQDGLNLKPKNRFIGGRVVILLDGLREPNVPGFFSLIKKFLDHFGCHLTSLQLAIRNAYMPFQDAFFIVAYVFKKCPNLRSFGIVNKFHANIADDLRDSIIEKFPLPDHSCIRYIDIGREDGRLDERDFLLPLLKKYSNQLCRLDLNVDVEAARYLCTLPLENLTELRVDGLSAEIMTLLRELHALSVRHMSVWFIPFYTSLQNILDTVNHFSKLTSLHIDLLGEQSGPKEEEIISVPVDTVLRSSITSLEITLGDLSVSLDFLASFPFAKKLVFHYKPPLGRFGRGEMIAYADGNIIGKGKLVHLFESLSGCASLPVGDSSKSYRGRESCLYGSNIWEILPFLQTLQFTGPEEVVKIRNVFTRSGYRASRYYKTWPND